MTFALHSPLKASLMARRCAGFGLIELMIALTLGLVLVMGVVQVFIASKQTLVVQRAAATLQEDARYLLGRLSQELRMLNMYGCLDLARLPESIRSAVPPALEAPISYSAGSTAGTLTLITAVPNAEIFTADTTRSASNYGARWLIVTNCRDTDDLRIASADELAVRSGDLVIPLRQVEYRVKNHALQIRNNGAGNFQTLIEGVADLSLGFGLAASADDRQVSGGYMDEIAAAQAQLVRSVKLDLQMSDNPQSPEDGQVRAQNFMQVVAIRNRID
ncbi:prepilin-type N-terminal cleavage/methylation domain-containing protein [Halopseudomonas pelagia]|uniref:Prepilin-type N-terminal cleavage/methylation domain-containing protein n=1 Tax=Halopseudomonas pelagia TaxID=553151 RepID=A0AA91Z8W6_9GAMM|nr:prepilin-type N-terminal cleavage/methylation domain-containing protein [Halopseudomonas pelagia]PCD01356.1 hypothetical protein CO192_00555 [Halopseudomonas pelagia]QFY55806.1 prepilin-type N-terminal cleavage/methylation domain-containing protein [Halopseudomonas pelagia]